MKVIILILILNFYSILFAKNPYYNKDKEILKEHPVNEKYLAIESGGELFAIDAYSDGIGVFVGSRPGAPKIDNSAMNELVFKHGEKAKKNKKRISEQVLLSGDFMEQKDIKFASALEIANSKIKEDGKKCNDKNKDTVDDIYVNGICIGTCDDKNPDTIDTLVLGSCEFILE